MALGLFLLLNPKIGATLWKEVYVGVVPFKYVNGSGLSEVCLKSRKDVSSLCIKERGKPCA